MNKLAAFATIIAIGAGTTAFAATNAGAATPTPASCTASVKWVMGQQVAAHIHITKALPSNATALVAYPSCGALSPQQLNSIVGADKTVKVDGPAVYTHWHK